jgi:multimeric flavodoxin WrbA
MKVTAFVGSARKKHTYQTTELFMQKLKALGDVECEIVRLSDYNLKICRGCIVCFDEGEELCQLKDDRDYLIDKMKNSDGVVFATPNYSFDLSGLMKVFLDRLGYIFHRPCFFGKTSTCIVTQGIYRGSKIVKYFNFIGGGLGFNVVKGSCIYSLEPMTEKGRKKIDKLIDRHGRKFYAQLIKKEYPSPSLLGLAAFRMGRTSRKKMLKEDHKDYRHFKEKGWFESDYYYPVRLNPIKKLFGKLLDKIAVMMVIGR